MKSSNLEKTAVFISNGLTAVIVFAWIFFYVLFLQIGGLYNSSNLSISINQLINQTLISTAQGQEDRLPGPAGQMSQKQKKMCFLKKKEKKLYQQQQQKSSGHGGWGGGAKRKWAWKGEGRKAMRKCGSTAQHRPTDLWKPCVVGRSSGSRSLSGAKYPP